MIFLSDKVIILSPYKSVIIFINLVASDSVLRNFNSPDHGSNLQHVKHESKTNLIKSVVTGEPTRLLRRRSNCKLGNTKSKCSRHILTTCISVVLNNFMKKRLATKSKESVRSFLCEIAKKIINECRWFFSEASRALREKEVVRFWWRFG